jgi:hypothetical protein
MESVLESDRFPELDWILNDADNTVIFCETITLNFRVAAYMLRKAKDLSLRGDCIRMHNSLNWLDFVLNNVLVSLTRTPV